MSLTYILYNITGATEEQYFNCKGTEDLYEMYATKMGKSPYGYYGNFGMECTGGEAVMNWQVLGPELTPDELHAVWNKGSDIRTSITSLHVYKTFEPKSQLWVVAGVDACFNYNYVNCVGPGNPPPSCDQSIKTGILPKSTDKCKVESTFAGTNERLFYWHFKTIITNSTNVRTPGVLLEFQVSPKPWPKAPKKNIGYIAPPAINLRST